MGHNPQPLLGERGWDAAMRRLHFAHGSSGSAHFRKHMPQACQPTAGARRFVNDWISPFLERLSA